MRGRLVFLVPVLALAASACSDGGGASGTGVAGTMGGAGGTTGAGGMGSDTLTGAALERCRAVCEAFAQCKGVSASACATTPTPCGEAPVNLWRDEVATAYLACVKGCPKDAETCATTAFAAAGERRAIDDEYSSACTEKRTKTCADTAVSFRDDYCLQSSIYLDAVVTRALACLDEPCADVPACLDGVFE